MEFKEKFSVSWKSEFKLFTHLPHGVYYSDQYVSQAVLNLTRTPQIHLWKLLVLEYNGEESGNY